jgi:hypothetical protein
MINEIGFLILKVHRCTYLKKKKRAPVNVLIVLEIRLKL